MERSTGTKGAATLRQRGSPFGTGLNIRCPTSRPLVSVGGNRLENQCLRPFPTGSHSPFSSSEEARRGGGGHGPRRWVASEAASEWTDEWHQSENQNPTRILDPCVYPLLPWFIISNKSGTINLNALVKIITQSTLYRVFRPGQPLLLLKEVLPCFSKKKKCYPLDLLRTIILS